MAKKDKAKKDKEKQIKGGMGEISDEDLITSIQKEVGEGNIRLGINSGGIMKIDKISTRCLPLDAALGIGGIPRGRTTEVFGAEASGKTTLALTIVAECQSNGGRAAYVDVEHAVDSEYAKNIGVDLDKLIFSQPDSGEKALKVCDLLISSGKVDLVVVDSVAALVPQAELDGDVEDSNVAGIARLMSKSMRMFTAKVSKSKTSLLFINQTRDKIGVLFGNPSSPTGGKALKYYASIRMEITRIGSLKKGDNIIGSRTRVKVIKNKFAPPFKIAEFDLIYGKGISTIGGIVESAIKHKIVEQSGSWFSYNNNKLGLGLVKTVEFLENNDDVIEEIKEKLRQVLIPEPTCEVEDVDEETGELKDVNDTEDDGVEISIND
ncbi:MAG TPA: recombinase RecA [Desulfatiglandales bacterium]|nr:recombinase RecA [Desulfatiglandales bacterium]